MKDLSQLPPLHTLGHSNLSYEQFKELLVKHGIETVIDVRSSPYSRYITWANRETLRAALRADGFQYVYGGSVLGGRAAYTFDSELFQQKMDRVVEVHSNSPSVMICAEKNPQQCHRAFKLTHYLHTAAPTLKINHILGMKEGVIDSREFSSLQKENWPFGVDSIKTTT